jgi:catechol 2,3-dioxygenase-like lactoylglutathione lyase family enzyme
VIFGGATPVLPVRDLEASIDYYVRVLGFTVDWHDPGIIASVSREQCGLFLSQGDQGHAGTWVWIGASDVALLFEEYRRKGARIRHAPANYDWAFEMQVEDLDGNVLRVGSEPRLDQPPGEWLDMRGCRWVKSASRWTRVEES